MSPDSPAPQLPDDDDAALQLPAPVTTLADAPAEVARRLDILAVSLLRAVVGEEQQSRDGAADRTPPPLAAAALARALDHLVLIPTVRELVARGAPAATERDVFYRHVRHFPTQRAAGRAVAHLSRALGVARRLLGVAAGARGFLAGCVDVNGCRVGAQPLALSGLFEDLLLLQQDDGDAAVPSFARDVSIAVPDGVRFFIIVEKDAVFNRLVGARIFDAVPCVLLTSCGFPTVAARAVAAAIARAAPVTTVSVALCDYNPAGVTIALNYRRGVAAARGEKRQLGADAGAPPAVAAVPLLRWLGLHACDVRKVAAAGHQHVLQPLTPRDRALLRGLLPPPQQHGDGAVWAAALPAEWAGEVAQMRDGGVRCELEALPRLEAAVVEKLLRHEYV